MINLFKKPSQNSLGLDISSEGISMVFLKQETNGVLLKNYDYIPFSKPIDQNNLLIESKIVSEALRSIINQNKPDIKNTVISIPANMLFIKKITLPDLSYDELQAIAPQEAAKYLPLTAKELNVDFEILENTRTEDETGKKVDIILCALSKSIARNYLDIISAAGFSVKAIDVSSFAIIKTLANAKLINNSEKTYISVFIDYTTTDISIIQEGMPVFSHNIQLGKKNIVENIINTMNKKRSEVLKLLPEVELMIPGSEINKNADLNKASSGVKNIYSAIAGEIQKTIEFFNSETTKPIDFEKIFLSGPGVCVQNIDKYIFNKLRIKTCILNPFLNISKELRNRENLLIPDNIPAFSQSVGLALKGIQK